MTAAIDRYGHLSDDGYSRLPVHMPDGGRYRQTVRTELVVNRPRRDGPHPLTPPQWAAALIWLAVTVAVVAGCVRLVLYLFA